MITIIVPVFNSSDTLEEAYNSLKECGVNNPEIIIVDDGSEDDSWQLISNIAADNPNIIIIRCDENRGGGSARNIGVSRASNDIIFILDSDDILVPGSLLKALNKMTELDVDAISQGKASCFRETYLKPENKFLFKAGLVSFEDLFSGNPNSVTGNMLIRKKAIQSVGGYPEHHGFDTQELGFKLLANNCKIHIDESLQFYYQRLSTYNKPSYYIRELRKGNVSKNWFYVFSETLFMFNRDVREAIINYEYGNPKLIASGENIYDSLIFRNKSKVIFNESAFAITSTEAYELYKDNKDPSLDLWCFNYEINNKLYNLAMRRFNKTRLREIFFIFLHTKLPKPMRPAYKPKNTLKFNYFIKNRMPFVWTFLLYKQKIINKLNKGKFFERNNFKD